MNVRKLLNQFFFHSVAHQNLFVHANVIEGRLVLNNASYRLFISIVSG